MGEQGWRSWWFHPLQGIQEKVQGAGVVPDEQPYIRIPLPPPEWERYIEEQERRERREKEERALPSGSSTGSVVIIEI